MAKTASINIRIDPVIKKSAEELFGAFGITITDAVNIFLHQSLMVGGLPFELKAPNYNAETEAAIKECEEMLSSGDFKRYLNADKLFDDILSGNEDGDV